LPFNSQEHGAAYEAGGLEVGQLILEVDSNKVEGMQHQVSTLVDYYEQVSEIILNFFSTRKPNRMLHDS